MFMDLDATDEQLDFPILYGIARQGIAVKDPAEVESIDIGEGDRKMKHTPEGFGGLNINPLLDEILEHYEPYPDRTGEPLQMQVSQLAYDDYIGRLGIGRITRGTVKAGQTVKVTKEGGGSRRPEDRTGICLPWTAENAGGRGPVRRYCSGVRHL